MNSLMRYKYSEDVDTGRGLISKGSPLEERFSIEPKIDELIKSIANWD